MGSDFAASGASILAGLDSAALTNWPEDRRVSRLLIPPERRALKRAAFVLDFSGRDLGDLGSPPDEIRGSHLTTYRDVFLFGPNLILDASGWLASEFRVDFRQFVEYAASDYFAERFPGRKPQIAISATGARLSARGFPPDDVVEIAEPVFLATPVEPENWGRWILTVAPKVAEWTQVREDGERLLCYADLNWQTEFLDFFGADGGARRPHAPGRLHFCRNLRTIEYSNAHLSSSAPDRRFFLSLARRVSRRSGPRPEKLFISRRSLALEFPGYRVMQNEKNLMAALERIGFVTIEPQNYPIAEQIALFHAARVVVALSGAGLFNLVFCKPGTRVVVLETDASHAVAHAALIASLELEYGVVFGRQSSSDPTPIHKRWRLPIGKTVAAISAFL